MLGLERLLQSNYHPASEITPSATYFPIRPAHSTRWPLLLCPFPASIFLHLPIDFLFADFACLGDLYFTIVFGEEQIFFRERYGDAGTVSAKRNRHCAQKTMYIIVYLGENV